MNDRSPFATLVLALAIVLSAWLIGRGIERFRAADRSVSVKGVAERTVQADIGLWPVRMVAADNDLEIAQRKITRDRRIVLAFLARFGLHSTATELQGFEVADTRANPYQNSVAANRFTITPPPLVRPGEPD